MRSPLLRLPLLAAALFLLARTDAPAQQPAFPTPRITAFSPGGAKVGTSVEVTLVGGDLEDISALHFGHPGIKAERVPDPPPPKPDPKDKKKAPTPPPAPVRFKVTVAPDVPLGVYDGRVVGKWGVSSPRAFVVGDQNEVLEKEPNNDVPEAQPVAINTTVNGSVAQKTDVDYYRFAGKRGQRVLVRCAASSVDSRLTPFLQLFGPGDRELAQGLRYDRRDALIDCTLPEDGDYLVRLCEHAYLNGGPEYFYRLTITDAPWIDAAYPPVVEAGKESEVTLFGRNLPGGKIDPEASSRGRPLERLTVRVRAPADADGRLEYSGTLMPRGGSIDGFEYRIKNASGSSNPVLLTVVPGPVVLDNGANDTPQTAQPVPVPCEICGRVEKVRDRDWYRFQAKKGDEFYVEGYADRLGSPADLYVRLLRADNQQAVGEFDDNADIPPLIGKFFTYTDDPKGKFVAPADGTYELLVGSRTGDGLAGPRHVYRVSVRRPRPDFRLVVVGNDEFTARGPTVRRGGSQDWHVVCFREDGFTGPVELTVEGLPKGVSCPTQVIGSNLRETALVVTAANDAADWTGEIKVTGTALIDGKKVARVARPGCLVWPTGPQQNVPAISRLARSTWLAVRDQGPFALVAEPGELSVPVGGQVEVKVKIQRHFADFKAPVQVTRAAAPPQPNGQPINVPNVNITAGQSEVTIRFPIQAKTPAGEYNLVFAGTAQFPYSKDPKGKKANVTVTQVTTPIKLTLYDAVAQVTLPAKLALKPGADTPLAVKLKRLNGFNGPLKLQLVVPNNLPGVSAAEVTVAAGANEGTLVVKVPANAKPGPEAKAVVKLTAQANKVAVTQESAVALAIQPAGKAQEPPPKTVGPPKTAGPTKEIAILPPAADGWRFLAAGRAPKGWERPGFDDAKWNVGRAPLGAGEEEINKRKGTIIPDFQQDFAFRKVVEVPADVANQKGVTFRLQVASDDTAVVYVNGELADRDPVADHEFMYWNRDVTLKPGLLKPGKNVIAVLVKNKPGSSDLYMDMQITAQVPGKK